MGAVNEIFGVVNEMVIVVSVSGGVAKKYGVEMNFK